MIRFKEDKFIEEYGYLLDTAEDTRIVETRGKRIKIKGLIGQIVGEERFMLMEFKLNEDATYEELERLYIGRGERLKAMRFIRYIRYEELTYKARESLPKAIEKAILINEDKWVDFFNKAGPLTPRTHTLELLSLIGKKTVMKIVEEREREPFKDFKDIKNRIKIDPVKALLDRIMSELSEEHTYYIFVRKIT